MYRLQLDWKYSREIYFFDYYRTSIPFNNTKYIYIGFSSYSLAARAMLLTKTLCESKF